MAHYVQMMLMSTEKSHRKMSALLWAIDQALLESQEEIAGDLVDVAKIALDSGFNEHADAFNSRLGEDDDDDGGAA